GAVTARVPQPIVDVLESVEIDEQERETVLLALGDAYELRGKLQKSAAIVQAGESVPERKMPKLLGLVGQALFELPADGDVAPRRLDVTKTTVGSIDAGHFELEPAVLAVAAAEPAGDDPAPRFARVEHLQVVARRSEILGVHQREGRHRPVPGARVAEQRLDR